MPVAALKARAKWKGLGQASLASLSMVRSLSCGPYVGRAQRQRRRFSRSRAMPTGGRRSLSWSPPLGLNFGRNQNTQDNFVKSVR